MPRGRNLGFLTPLVTNRIHVHDTPITRSQDLLYSNKKSSGFEWLELDYRTSFLSHDEALGFYFARTKKVFLFTCVLQRVLSKICGDILLVSIELCCTHVLKSRLSKISLHFASTVFCMSGISHAGERLRWVLWNASVTCRITFTVCVKFQG